MKATYKKYTLKFKRPSGTSRGILTDKETWFIQIEDKENKGIGECGILRGLSADDTTDYESKLAWTCENISLGLNTLYEELRAYPSIQFGLEQAFRMLETKSSFKLFPSGFTSEEKAIAINGLVWMGDEAFMKSQIEEKINTGFTCIKLKIGAIDFDTEVKLIRSIRKDFNAQEIEIRVDANGAFKAEEALEKLKTLSELELHSIEQPIKQGQIDQMAVLCENTPLDIALDEELIGIFDVTNKQKIVQTIQPQYIILKPSLIGGYKGSQEWIDLAEKYEIGWWITSALESNVGLNAIAQWTYTKESDMPQGLGTGSLFTNNFESPLEVENGKLYYRENKNWNFNLI
ncbi:o-succinylbenzoate synthase [Flavobacteriaceae bacterium R38]|nr:o-succinylbenzoate synthase [Flavobacteriaceae bacterium R38]